jgi:hypothetical protein
MTAKKDRFTKKHAQPGSRKRFLALTRNSLFGMLPLQEKKPLSFEDTFYDRTYF